jgi:RNA polymerase sigma-70 factor, ECF subfamily
MQSPVAVDALRAHEKLEGDALLADYVQRYRSLVERLCRILLGNASDAEDAAQQTFLLAYQSLLAGTRPHQPRAWLCTIARRECWARDHRRRRERDVPREVARAEPDPAERTVMRAELATINAGLEQLPVRQRQAIVLRELAGLSYTQLAAAMEVSESAAEALLVRARRNLREARLVLVLLSFPDSLRRLLRLGSGHARAAVGAQAVKAVAVATIVTATTAVAGAGVPAERVASPKPSIARATPAPKPAARKMKRRAPSRRVAVRRARPVAVQPHAPRPVGAPVHVESATPTPAAQALAGDPPATTTTARPLSPAKPDPPVRASTPTAREPSPHPKTPRSHTTTTPNHVPPPPPAETTPTETAPPPPTETDPSVTPLPPPPTETTETAPPVPEEPPGTGADGDTKPGNGKGDKNHDHFVKR